MIVRKRRAPVGTYVEPPLAPLAPIDRVVDEGAIIYVSSARMTVKNLIIVAALGRNVDYEPAALRDALRAELLRLADDNLATAARLENEAAAPIQYEAELDRELVRQKREDHARRPRVHRLIAEVLHAEAASEQRLEAVVDQARHNAVEEMFLAVQSQLTDRAVEPDADYESVRAQRIRDFVAVDLLGGSEAPSATGTRKRKRG